MAVTIVQSSQHEDGYVSKDIVTIMIDDESDGTLIRCVTAEYVPPETTT